MLPVINFSHIQTFAEKTMRTIRDSAAVRQSIILSVGTTITGVVLGFAFILLSRFLGPEKFGVLSVSIALMTILMRIPDMGLNQTMLKLLGNWHGQSEKTQPFLAAMLFWKGVLSLALFVIGMLFVPVLAHVLSFPHPELLRLTIFGAACFFLFDYVIVVLSADHEFYWVSVMNVMQAAIKVFGFGALLLFGAREVLPLATVYYLAAPLIGVLFLWKFRSHLWVWPRSGSRKLWSQIRKLVFHVGAGTILFTLISNIDILFVQRALSPFETGIYSGAGRIAMFVAFLASAVSGVLNNRVARYQDSAVLRRYLRKSVLVVLAAIAGFALFFPLAHWIVFYSIGPEYLSGVHLVVLLVANAFLGLALVPYISFFYAVDRPSYFSVSGVLQLAVILLGNILFLPAYGLAAAAWSRIFATVILGAYTLFALRNELRKS